MTWKIEFAALAITAAGVGGYLYNTSPFEEAPIRYHDSFTEADFDAFDRHFSHNGEICDIGLKASDVCLPEFKISQNIEIGQPFPNDVLRLSAGMRVLLALDTKEPDLKTIRVGQTLALIHRETLVVQDVIRLDAVTYADARKPELSGAGNIIAAN